MLINVIETGPKKVVERIGVKKAQKDVNMGRSRAMRRIRVGGPDELGGISWTGGLQGQ